MGRHCWTPPTLASGDWHGCIHMAQANGQESLPNRKPPQGRPGGHSQGDQRVVLDGAPAVVGLDEGGEALEGVKELPAQRPSRGLCLCGPSPHRRTATGHKQVTHKSHTSHTQITHRSHMQHIPNINFRDKCHPRISVSTHPLLTPKEGPLGGGPRPVVLLVLELELPDP